MNINMTSYYHNKGANVIDQSEECLRCRNCIMFKCVESQHISITM